MAAPNIVSVSTITGITTYISGINSDPKIVTSALKGEINTNDVKNHEHTSVFKCLKYLFDTSRSRGLISQGSYGSLLECGGLTSGLARPSPLALATKLHAS